MLNDVDVLSGVPVEEDPEFPEYALLFCIVPDDVEMVYDASAPMRKYDFGPQGAM